jgi:glycosyltransferase involved in cell wall biosynthesis
MHKPKISIMMPAYNAELYIQAAIESVLAQTYSDWELVIVDDGSTDRTAEIIHGFQDERIRYYWQANAGEAAARNTALGKLQGEWLAFIDADDLFLPNHLELAMAYLELHPEKDAVYSDGLHIDSDGRQLQSLSSRRRGPFEGWIFEQVVRASDVFGPPLCVVMRRSLIDAHQLQYDTRIVIGPDWDFFTRYSEYADFGYINNQTCLYRVHLTNITVLTGLDKRAGYLAICRQNALQLASFARCSVETRGYVFYDLLINLLAGDPEQQDQIINLPQFDALPDDERARILRLMASQAILRKDIPSGYPVAWLEQARRRDPADRKTRFLYFLVRLHPAIGRQFIRLRRQGQPDQSKRSPFSDLNLT